jgi:hypothetical protein
MNVGQVTVGDHLLPKLPNLPIHFAVGHLKILTESQNFCSSGECDGHCATPPRPSVALLLY